MQATLILGVDVGGTKILTGVLDGQGRVLGEPVKAPTKPAEPTAEGSMGAMRVEKGQFS